MILLPLCQPPHMSQDWAVVAGVNSYHLARCDCVHCPPILCSVTSSLQLEIVGSLKSAVVGVFTLHKLANAQVKPFVFSPQRAGC